MERSRTQIGVAAGEASAHGLPPMEWVENDPLSSVLLRLNVRCVVPSPSTLRGAWGFELPQGPAGFYFTVEGRAWLEFDGAGEWLEPGDFVLLAHGAAHRLLHAPSAAASHPQQLVNREKVQEMRGIEPVGDGPPTRLLSGCLLLEGSEGAALARSLPALWRARVEDPSCRAWLKPLVEMLIEVAQHRGPGVQAMLDRLLQIAFVELLRLQLATPNANTNAWLQALFAPDLGPAIVAMHTRLDEHWSIERLARLARLSRSAFAERFQRQLGCSPGAYLVERRMRRADELLRNTPLVSKQIARSVGYASEGAFSAAFKRWAGESPRSRRSTGRPSAI
jgi:AraC-like DNA-binding protein